MFGEFNEAAQPKNSLAKYSTEFNDLAVQSHPHRIPYLRLLGRPYTLLYVSRSVGRLHNTLIFFYRFVLKGFLYLNLCIHARIQRQNHLVSSHYFISLLSKVRSSLCCCAVLVINKCCEIQNNHYGPPRTILLVEKNKSNNLILEYPIIY